METNKGIELDKKLAEELIEEVMENCHCLDCRTDSPIVVIGKGEKQSLIEWLSEKYLLKDKSIRECVFWEKSGCQVHILHQLLQYPDCTSCEYIDIRGCKHQGGKYCHHPDFAKDMEKCDYLSNEKHQCEYFEKEGGDSANSSPD